MKTVVVTGATRGLGLAIATRLVADGYRVVGIGRSASDGFAALVAANPEAAILVTQDLGDLDALHPLATRLAREHKPIWGLVNNAAIGNAGVLATMHERDIADLLRINVQSPILLTKYLLRPMLTGGGGRVVNITSVVAATGYTGLAAYGATKAALAGFTRSLAREVGKAGITVNAVAPGFMETAMTSGLEAEQLASVRRRSPLGVLASTGDAAGAVAWLLGEDAAHVTGTTITVDAGSTA
jgi:3-oxoacyl-[acyl-carrier protein] reductase